MGNPFLENSEDLLVLDTRDIMSSAVTETVRRIETIGEELYKNYVEERLEKCEKPVITKNKISIISYPCETSTFKGEDASSCIEE